MHEISHYEPFSPCKILCVVPLLYSSQEKEGTMIMKYNVPYTAVSGKVVREKTINSTCNSSEKHCGHFQGKQHFKIHGRFDGFFVVCKTDF